MERIGVFFKLKPGKKGEYIERHDHIWPEMKRVLDDAGFRNYSIWNHNDMLFGYYELKDSEYAKRFLAQNETFCKWRIEMEAYIYIEPGSGQKEWFMDLVFFHE